MAARDFNTPLKNIDDAVSRLYRLAALAQAGTALMHQQLELVETYEEFQSAVFLLEKLEDDSRHLAFSLEELGSNHETSKTEVV